MILVRQQGRCIPRGVRVLVQLFLCTLATGASHAAPVAEIQQKHHLIFSDQISGLQQFLKLSPTLAAQGFPTEEPIRKLGESLAYASDEQRQNFFNSLQALANTSAAGLANARPTTAITSFLQSDQALATPIGGAKAQPSFPGLNIPFPIFPLRQASGASFQQQNMSLPANFQLLPPLLPWASQEVGLAVAPSAVPVSAPTPSPQAEPIKQQAEDAVDTQPATGTDGTSAGTARLRGAQVGDPAQPGDRARNSQGDSSATRLARRSGQRQAEHPAGLQLQEVSPKGSVVATNRTYQIPGEPNYLLPDRPGPLIPINRTYSTNASSSVAVQNTAAVRVSNEAPLRRPMDISGWPADPSNGEGGSSIGSWGGQEAGTHGTEALAHALRQQVANMGLSPSPQASGSTPGSDTGTLPTGGTSLSGTLDSVSPPVSAPVSPPEGSGSSRMLSPPSASPEGSPSGSSPPAGDPSVGPEVPSEPEASSPWQGPPGSDAGGPTSPPAAVSAPSPSTPALPVSLGEELAPSASAGTGPLLGASTLQPSAGVTLLSPPSEPPGSLILGALPAPAPLPVPQGFPLLPQEVLQSGLGPAVAPTFGPALPPLAPAPALPALPALMESAAGPAIPFPGAPGPGPAVSPPFRILPEPVSGSATEDPHPDTASEEGVVLRKSAGPPAGAPGPVAVPGSAAAVPMEAPSEESCVRVSHVLPSGGVFVECQRPSAPPPSQAGIIPLWEAPDASEAGSPTNVPQAEAALLAGSAEGDVASTMHATGRLNDMARFGIGIGVCLGVAALVALAVFLLPVRRRRKRKYDSRGRRLRPDSPSSAMAGGGHPFFPPLVSPDSPSQTTSGSDEKSSDLEEGRMGDQAGAQGKSPQRPQGPHGSQGDSADPSPTSPKGPFPSPPPLPLPMLPNVLQHPAARTGHVPGTSSLPAMPTAAVWASQPGPPPLPPVPTTPGWSWLITKNNLADEQAPGRRGFSASSEVSLDPELGLRPSTSLAGSPLISDRSDLSSRTDRPGIYVTAPDLDPRAGMGEPDLAVGAAMAAAAALAATATSHDPSTEGTTPTVRMESGSTAVGVHSQIFLPVVSGKEGASSDIGGEMGYRDAAAAGAPAWGPISSPRGDGWERGTTRALPMTPVRLDDALGTQPSLGTPFMGDVLDSEWSLLSPRSPGAASPGSNTITMFHNPLAQEGMASRSQTPSPEPRGPFEASKPESSFRRTGARARSASPLGKPSKAGSREAGGSPETAVLSTGCYLVTGPHRPSQSPSQVPPFLLRTSPDRLQPDSFSLLVETATSSFYDASEMRTSSQHTTQLFYSMSESELSENISAAVTAMESLSTTPILATPTGSRPVTPELDLAIAHGMTISTSPVPGMSPPITPSGSGKRSVREIYLEAVRISAQLTVPHGGDSASPGPKPGLEGHKRPLSARSQTPSESQGTLSRASSAIFKAATEITPRCEPYGPSSKRLKRTSELDPDDAVDWILDP
eukprot:jgi/Botrbrau1/15704/Bobra.4_1s0077.1